MATVKNGVLSAPRDWARHLKPWGKRWFWRRERQAVRRAIGAQL